MGGMQVKLHAFVSCALGEGEGRLFDRVISDLHWPLDRVLGGFQSVSEDCVEGNVCLWGIEPRLNCSVTSSLMELSQFEVLFCVAEHG
jgi:hypothetical protein